MLTAEFSAGAREYHHEIYSPETLRKLVQESSRSDVDRRVFTIPLLIVNKNLNIYY